MAGVGVFGIAVVIMKSVIELLLQEEKLASSTKLHKDSYNSSTDTALTERQTY